MTSVPMMTCLPWARGRRTSGVSAGRATTSSATGRSSAAGPPDIPTGGRVDQQLPPGLVRGHGQLVPQQPGRNPARRGDPDPGRRVRRLRLHLHDIPRARPAVQPRGRLLIVPVQVALTPLVGLYGDLGLNGTYAAVYLAHIGFNMPLAVFILRSYLATLPTAVIESAK